MSQAAVKPANPVTFDTISMKLLNKVESVIDSVIDLLPAMVIAILVLIIFYFLSRLTSRLTNRALHRVSSKENVIQILSTSARSVVFLLGVFLALVILDIEKAVTSLLAGAGVIGLVLGLAFKEIASNYMSGIILAFREPFKVGQIVESNGYQGTVREINLRTTILETFDGQRVHIPNAEVFNKPIINYSATGRRRISVLVGVHYDTDLKLAEQTLQKMLKEQDYVLDNPGFDTVFCNFNDSSIDIKVRYWVEYHSNTVYMSSISRMVKAIKASFDSAGIEIPFPIRTVVMNNHEGAPV